jgi:hypothetical protein
MMHDMTTDPAQTKEIRRRTLREAFPYPLNQIALWHVDSVAALDDAQKLILCKALLKTDLRFAVAFIDVLNKSAVVVHHEDDLTVLIPLSDSQPISSMPMEMAAPYLITSGCGQWMSSNAGL